MGHQGEPNRCCCAQPKPLSLHCYLSLSRRGASQAERLHEKHVEGKKRFPPEGEREPRHAPPTSAAGSVC